MNINIGDMSEALYQLRKEGGLFYTPSEMEILNKAIITKRKAKVSGSQKTGNIEGGRK